MPVTVKKPLSTTPDATPKKSSAKAGSYANVRHENLRLLVFEYGSRAELAGKLGLKPEALETYLMKPPKGVSTNFARTIEKALEKPHGWMDRKNYDLALTADEWFLLEAFREGSHRDRVVMSALANVLGAMPEGK